MTLVDILTGAANFHETDLAGLTVNSQNLGLLCANQARRTAEQETDWEFSRKLVAVSVDGVNGGSLDSAVEASTGVPVIVGTILDVGLFECLPGTTTPPTVPTSADFIPFEWTTTGESKVRERLENPYRMPRHRYPSDSQYRHELHDHGENRFIFSGNTIKHWPLTRQRDGTSITYLVAIECYTQMPDWISTAEDAVVVGTTGVVTVNGTYVPLGYYNGQILYANTGTVGTTFLLWYNGTKWIISYAADLGNPAPVNYAYYTVAAGAVPNGAFTAVGTFTGMPVATATAIQNIWTTLGQQYLLWQTIVNLNLYFKTFVPRTEGNLGPGDPLALANAGLEALRNYDVSRFEQNRRHAR